MPGHSIAHAIEWSFRQWNPPKTRPTPCPDWVTSSDNWYNPTYLPPDHKPFQYSFSLASTLPETPHYPTYRTMALLDSTLTRSAFASFVCPCRGPIGSIFYFNVEGCSLSGTWFAWVAWGAGFRKTGYRKWRRSGSAWLFGIWTCTWAGQRGSACCGWWRVCGGGWVFANWRLFRCSSWVI